MSYPKEDVCLRKVDGKVCGQHIGWILDPMGEKFALGICDEHREENGTTKEEESTEEKEE